MFSVFATLSTNAHKFKLYDETLQVEIITQHSDILNSGYSFAKSALHRDQNVCNETKCIDIGNSDAVSNQKTFSFIVSCSSFVGLSSCIGVSTHLELFFLKFEIEEV